MPSTDFIDEHPHNEYSDDDEEDTGPEQLDIQNWMEWYSNDLLNMWMGLRAYREDTYLTHALMKDATFHDFCEFVYHFSHKYPDRHAT
jgi:hypothetical protein